MKFNVNEAFQFYAIAVRHAEAQPRSSENEALLFLASLVGKAIDARVIGDATKFRNSLIGIAALAATAEQWTMRAPIDASDCECEDCTAKAVAAQREQRERDAQDLTLRDFWWANMVNAASPFGSLIVTQARSSWPNIPLSDWHPIRAVHYGDACVIASEEFDACKKKNNA